jgi:hypothetical protein
LFVTDVLPTGHLEALQGRLNAYFLIGAQQTDFVEASGPLLRIKRPDK